MTAAAGPCSASFGRAGRAGRGRRPAQGGGRPLPGGLTHAWLFTGPPGSGRSVAARAFAAALLCAGRAAASARRAARSPRARTPTCCWSAPTGCPTASGRPGTWCSRRPPSPVYGGWRIVLFEDADRATEQAANALLKAIEEPPPRTIWLLCAPSAADLPTTIRSRCRLVTLRTPPTAAVAEVLEREGVGPRRAGGGAGVARPHRPGPPAGHRRRDGARREPTCSACRCG